MLRKQATGFLRRHLASGSDEDLPPAIDAIGSEAVSEASNLAGRFPNPDGAIRGAGETLEALRLLVDAVHAPSRPGAWALFARPVPPLGARLASAEPRLSALLDQLVRDQDGLSQQVIGLRGILQQLAGADRALEEAVYLCRALQAAIDSAARELGPSDPARAAKLDGAIRARVTERLRDLVTHLVIVRQGRLSLQTISDNQESLARAIIRTRTSLVAALRTAAAARRAAGQSPSTLTRDDGRDAGTSDLERAVDAMRSALSPSQPD